MTIERTTNATHTKPQLSKDQRLAQHKAGIAALSLIAASGFIGSMMRGFGPVHHHQRVSKFDHQRVSKPLPSEQEQTIIKRCHASIRDGKRKRPGHRPKGSRVAHYKAMRTAECSVNRSFKFALAGLVAGRKGATY